jgi:hypothetical protein
MPNHAQRAAVVMVLFMVFTAVRLAWPFLTSLVSGSGALGAALFDPVEFLGQALFVWALTYCVSKWWSRHSTAAR